MKNRTGLWFIAYGSIMLIFLVVAFIIPDLKEFWQAPLGPSLGFEDTPTVSILPTGSISIETIAVPNQDAPAADVPTTAPIAQQNSNPTPVNMPTYTPSAVCGDDPQMIVLAIGIDYRKGNYTYGLADVIRIVKVDFINPSVSVLTMPRDLWVEVPGISDHYGITHSKLNQSYFYGTPAMGYYDGPGGGAGLLARTLDQNFGVQPEHYGVVNMLILQDMIDAIGGVDIYLEHGIDARESAESLETWKVYPAGWNHLNGKRAVYYARIRHIDNVFGRTDRQTEILCAIKNKVLSPSTVMGIPEMIAAFSDNVLTDLSPAQLSQLACLAPHLTSENISFARFPESDLTGTTVYDPNMQIYDFVWDVDNQTIRSYVAGFLDGTWPPPPDETTPDDSNHGTTQMLCPEYPSQ